VSPYTVKLPSFAVCLELLLSLSLSSLLSSAQEAAMLGCLADHCGSMCRAPAIGILFLSLFFSVLSNTSTACSNGNCQVPLFSTLSVFLRKSHLVSRSVQFHFLFLCLALSVQEFSGSGSLFVSNGLWGRPLLWRLPCFGEDPTFLHQRPSHHSQFHCKILFCF
jgi:hypothetical protein